MKSKLFVILAFQMVIYNGVAQVTLSSNGPGNTYEEINAVLAPGYNVIEVPDCEHTAFGRHIDEVFDTELNTNVYRFIAHKISDNDRCINFDRQRTEIKTYDQSPANLKAVQGETVVYKWKFKIELNFQPSPNFTHLHQIKSVGGSYASIPMITLTARKASPNRIELRHTATTNQTTKKTANLDLFEGHWVEVNEVITYGDNGSYFIEIKRISDNTILLSYSNNTIDMWQDGAEFARPKWGIYRSLLSIDDLRDENVYFNDFSIEEIDPLSISDLETQATEISLFPNPSKESIIIKNIELLDYDNVMLYNNLGEIIPIENRFKENKIDVSDFNTGLYYIVFTKNRSLVKALKCLVEN